VYLHFKRYCSIGLFIKKRVPVIKIKTMFLEAGQVGVWICVLNHAGCKDDIDDLVVTPLQGSWMILLPN